MEGHRESKRQALKAQLEDSAAALQVLFSTGNGATWEDNWYLEVAKATKMAFGNQVSCRMQWSSPDVDRRVPTPEDIAADVAAGGWKARLIADDMGARPNSIIVGHSAGGNAALRVAERCHVAGLVVVGAGFAPLDYENDCRRRAKAAEVGKMPEAWSVIEPWDFDSIVTNTNFVCIMHGEDDPVIPVREAHKLAVGLQAASKIAQASGKQAATIQCHVLTAGFGHAQQSHCEEVLAAILAKIKLLIDIPCDHDGSLQRRS
eukprot:TRINITY_DN106006_c0_g1_i1.p1 TRINITY_DN106006_c0_g1~~TRINITY_DN106006_c0_g1_i1.p1  ORF type:complete len:261 (-),score=43.06 TRINITY_DN106006_c0_g1_i1:121-903(-)